LNFTEGDGFLLVIFTWCLDCFNITSQFFGQLYKEQNSSYTAK